MVYRQSVVLSQHTCIRRSERLLWHTDSCGIPASVSTQVSLAICNYPLATRLYAYVYNVYICAYINMYVGITGRGTAVPSQHL